MDSPYKPAPLDTSSTQLDPEVQAKVEALAKNNHDVWARERMREGWIYGPERNDSAKQHPGLVPYELLSESEKDIDRSTALQVLKAAVALGCEIDVPAAQAAVGEQDDMSQWPKLAQPYEKARRRILKTYKDADTRAQNYQKWHRFYVAASVLLGTGAVLAAILELIVQDPTERWAARIEFAFAFLAIAAVLSGIIAARMPKWLIERHRAERCRFLKYRFLLDLAAAGPGAEGIQLAQEAFAAQMSKIEVLEDADLEQWMEEDPIPEDPPDLLDRSQIQNDLQDLATHYANSRLASQARYFFAKSSQDSMGDVYTKNLPPLLFFGSIAAAFMHFVLPYVFPAHGESFPKALVVTAAWLPAIASGVRLWRSAFEYSRNTLRFRAKYTALQQLMQRLESDLKAKPQLDPEVVIRDLWKGEVILENEHREWLRLMKEAEWFG